MNIILFHTINVWLTKNLDCTWFSFCAETCWCQLSLYAEFHVIISWKWVKFAEGVRLYLHELKKYPKANVFRKVLCIVHQGKTWNIAFLCTFSLTVKHKGPFTPSISISTVTTLMTLAILFSLKTMELLENGLQPHSGVTPLFSMRTESLALMLTFGVNRP